MSLMAQLGTGTVTTTDAAIVAAVPSGQLHKVQYITIQQPAGSTAKVLKIGTGTTATAANVKLTRSIPAGFYSEVILAPFTLAAAATLNAVVDTGTTELSYSVQGTKDLVA
jgi:hypothetical protein